MKAITVGNSKKKWRKGAEYCYECQNDGGVYQTVSRQAEQGFVSGVQETFDYIETNMLRVGMAGLLPILRDRRERCIDNLNGKQGNQDYYLGCLAVLDFCLKE